MPLYPVLNPVPDNINNPLILTLPPSNSTTTGYTLDTPLLQNILYPCLALSGGTANDLSNTHIRCLDGSLALFDNFTGADASLSESDRNSIREALTVVLAGTAQAASPCCLAYVGGDAPLPGYSEENSWAIFTTADNGEDGSTNLTAGGFTATSAHFAWLLSTWDHAWKAAIAAGVIPPGSAYIVRASPDGTAVAPYGYVECYGFDNVDDVASIVVAANWLLTHLVGVLINITPYQP